ncbi:MAG: hypothetical protein ACE5H2_05345 [Terriglobia bacterium]
MKEKGKFVVLFVLLAVLVGLNVRWGRGTPSLAVSGKGPAAVEEAGQIPDVHLRVDLLAKAQSRVKVGRNIFEYRVRAVPTPAAPAAAPVAASSAPPRRDTPPAPLRFYGFAEDSQSGQKRVFLTDGEEIFIAVEGETLLRRYRVRRVRATSIELEDLVEERQWVVPLEQP